MKKITCAVTHFGAQGDGVAINTVPIQNAIDVCAKSGGGTVFVPPGQYVTGTVLLKSGVTLSLDKDAVLLGSLNPDDYKLVDAFIDGVDTQRGFALGGCIGASRVGIDGPGTIDGRGAELQRLGGKNPAAKAFLVRCVNSATIVIRNVHLRNSSAWTLHLFQSSGVRVENVSIHSVGLANNDGIDIDSSQNVTISDCTIESSDDAICLKTTSSVSCENIHVRDCTLSSSCAGLKIGTESLGDFSDIHFEKCLIKNADRSAIKILSVDGSQISRVTIEDITVETADTPVFLRLGARLKTFRPGDSKRSVGSISQIVIRNVSVANAKRVGVLVSGIPGSTVNGVDLENLRITMSAEDSWMIDPQPSPLERIDSYPENNMFGPTLPAYGIYLRHVTGVNAREVRIAIRAKSSLPAIVCEEGKDLNIEDLTLDGENESVSAILFQSVRGAVIRRPSLIGDWVRLLRVEGQTSTKITLAAVRSGNGGEVFSLGDGISGDAVKVR